MWYTFGFSLNKHVQSIDQPVNQSAMRQPVSHAVSQSVSQPASQSVGQSTNRVIKNGEKYNKYKMSSSLFGTGWTMVLKVVTGTLVSTNIQEFWTSDIGLNLQDVKPLNVGSPVKIPHKSRYVKRWTSIKPKEVDKHHLSC